MMDEATVVTGASGFLGRAIVTVLAAQGHRVIACGRDAARLATIGAAADRVVFRPGTAPPDLRCSTVIHCAGLSTAWATAEAFTMANVDGTIATLKAARQWGCAHFIHVSSPSVYFRFADQFGSAESDPLPAPVNAYAASKAASEKAVARYAGCATTIVRPRGIYGRGDKSLLPRLIEACRRGPLPLLRGGGAVTDLTHVVDAAEAFAAIAAAPPPDGKSRIFNVSGGEPLALKEIVERVAGRARLKVRWVAAPARPFIAAVRAMEALTVLRGGTEPTLTGYTAGILAYSQTLDISAVSAAAGWRPRIRFDEGLEATFG